MSNKKSQKNRSHPKGDHPSGENREVAISVKNVSKTFQVPHEKVDSVRSAFVNALNTRGQTFEEFHALKDVSFEVKKGEFLGIIGSNGAGKSTLLKVLAGVYNSDEGSIEVNGLISPFLELGIGFNPELSGRDNVYLNATVLGLTQNEIDEKFDEIIAFAELDEFVDQQLKNYSSGMRARLAFAVSISANRDILLMDEVLAVGDNRFQEKCLDIFKGYRDQGRTVILVTHGMSVVREYCDRALLLDHGKLLDIGDVDEVADAYILNNMTKDQRAELKKKEESEKKEKKRSEDLKKGENIRDKSKEAIITNIEVFDRDRKTLKEISKNESFSVDVTIDINELERDLVLAVQIIDANTEYFLCGNNTLRNAFDCEWKKGENIISLTFKNIMFNIGTIYIRAILSAKNDGNPNEVIHLYPDRSNNEKIQEINLIQDKDSGGGIMRIEHEWSKE